MPDQTIPLGVRLIRLLQAHGVDTVFGIPGVHTVELYRGLATSPIRHITPRHEQGAAFMADGYARVSGKPGVCLLITGPGLTNAATAMGQALADSVPMLVITGVAPVSEIGMGRGGLHEMPDQRAMAVTVSRFSRTILHPAQLDPALAEAFALFASARPGPVHIEIPIDLMSAEVEQRVAALPSGAPVLPDAEAIAAVAARLSAAARPLILAGGGAVARPGGAEALQQVAAALDAPVVETVNARGAMAGGPLAIPASPSLEAVRAEIAAADMVLAVGTELGPTDYDMYDRGGPEIPGTLIRIDIDAAQMQRNVAPDIALIGDAAATLEALASTQLARAADRLSGAARAVAVNAAAKAEIGARYRGFVAVLDAVRDALPGARIVGDSTQAVYAGNLYYEAPSPRSWFNAATGFGALGYGLPAAIGAQLADPDSPVVCLIGDGGLQFVLGEMAAAVDAGTPVIILLWNNQGYGEIKSYMIENQVAPEGVDLFPPDFQAIGPAMGWSTEVLSRIEDLPERLKNAASRKAPSLIEIPEAIVPEA